MTCCHDFWRSKRALLVEESTDKKRAWHTDVVASRSRTFWVYPHNIMIISPLSILSPEGISPFDVVPTHCYRSFLARPGHLGSWAMGFSIGNLKMVDDVGPPRGLVGLDLWKRQFMASWIRFFFLTVFFTRQFLG